MLSIFFAIETNWLKKFHPRYLLFKEGWLYTLRIFKISEMRQPSTSSLKRWWKTGDLELRSNSCVDDYTSLKNGEKRWERKILKAKTWTAGNRLSVFVWLHFAHFRFYSNRDGRPSYIYCATYPFSFRYSCFTSGFIPTEEVIPLFK